MREEILEKLLALIGGLNLEGIELADVTKDSKLIGDIGLSSLSMFMVAYEIENTFEIRFENDALEHMNTVGDAVELIFQYMEKSK